MTTGRTTGFRVVVFTLHGVAVQKTTSWTFSAPRTSNLSAGFRFPGGAWIFLFVTTSTPVLGPCQLIQLVRRQGRESDHHYLEPTFKCADIYLYHSAYLRGVVRNLRYVCRRVIFLRVPCTERTAERSYLFACALHLGNLINLPPWWPRRGWEYDIKMDLK